MNDIDRMDPVIKTKWIAALRSGEYKQGKNNLNINDEFCCLGVLCDLAVKEGVPVQTNRSGIKRYFDGDASYLPKIVRTWARLGQRNNPRVYTKDEGAQALAKLNDQGTPFSEIADLIEEFL